MEQCETLLNRLVDRLREEERPALKKRIEQAVAEHTAGQVGHSAGHSAGQAGGDGGALDETGALRFLQDLDIFVNMRGPEFMYSRGIAETLRVGEDIFELAYVMKQATR